MTREVGDDSWQVKYLYERRTELCKLMASNLSVLREKAKLKQDDLADAVGLSRQTISAIENEKREMQWSTFSVLTLFFATNSEIKRIMVAMGILDKDIETALRIKGS